MGEAFVYTNLFLSQVPCRFHHFSRWVEKALCGQMVRSKQLASAPEQTSLGYGVVSLQLRLPHASSASSASQISVCILHRTMAQPSEAQIFERLHSYPFISDPEFANGLSIILGHPDNPATEVEMNRDDDLVLRAKCFFFSRYVEDIYAKWVGY